MKQMSTCWVLALALALFGQACALSAGEPEPSAEAPGASEPDAPSAILSASCERMDDLGLAAQGLRLHAENVDALESPCISLDGNRLAAVGDRACSLVTPTGFSLNGCFDSYDCGGCPVAVRADADHGFVLTGQSTSAECADVAAKYALVAGPVCSAMPRRDQR